MTVLSTAPYGVGQPADVGTSGGSVLRDVQTGRSTGSRRIDPRTRDYVLDSYGRSTGMHDVQQLVLLAVSTDRGSSSLRELGQALRLIDRITDNFERRVDSTMRAALQDLASRGLIEVTKVTIERLGSGRALINVRWRDMTTKQEHDTGVSI